MNVIINLLQQNKIIGALVLIIILDIIIGTFRAIKTKQFNQTDGINGAIRKATEIVVIIIFTLIDSLFDFDLTKYTAMNVLSVLGITKLGLAEFFSVMFIAYELTSILKNLTLCGVWIPDKFKNIIYKWIENITGEKLFTEEENTNNVEILKTVKTSIEEIDSNLVNLKKVVKNLNTSVTKDLESKSTNTKTKL